MQNDLLGLFLFSFSLYCQRAADLQQLHSLCARHFFERFHPLFLTIYHNRPLHRKEQRGREMHKLFWPRTVRIIAVPPFILMKRVVFKSAYFEMKDVEVEFMTHTYTHIHILLLSSDGNTTSFSYKSHLPLFSFSGDDCASNACNWDFRRVNTACTTYESPVNSECVAPQTVTEKKRKQSFFPVSPSRADDR